MAIWRTPVFDRTMDDAKSLDRTSAAYQKGALNADDLNRIEDNFKYLMAKLRSDAIFIPHRLRYYTENAKKMVETEVPKSILPDGYTQVEFIQSTGTQYINTGFAPNNNTRVVMDVQPLSGSSPEDSTVAMLFGARTAATSNNYAFAICYGKMRTDYNNAYSLEFSANPLNRAIVDKNKETTTVNKETLSYANVTFQASVNLTLFALNHNGTVKWKASVKLYSCMIYDNGILIRNYIPCINPSGTAGLYDLVNSEFCANAGEGTFGVGPKIEPETEIVIMQKEITTTYTDWQENNIPWLSEINRIRANHNALARLFLVGLGFHEQTESNYLDFGEVNDWERIVFAGKTMFENMEKEYRYCGMEHSGGERLL